MRLVGAPGGVALVNITVPVAPALLAGELVAGVKLVGPVRFIEFVPSVATDASVTTSTDAKFIVTLLVKTKPLGTM